MCETSRPAGDGWYTSEKINLSFDELLLSDIKEEGSLNLQGSELRLCSIFQHERNQPNQPLTLSTYQPEQPSPAGWYYLHPLPQQDLDCSIGITELKDISFIHKHVNIALFDFYDLLANPPSKFKEWVKRLGYENLSYNAVIDELHPVTAFICKATNRAYYLPRYETKNKLLKTHKSTLNSSSRFTNNLIALCKAIKADYIIDLVLTAPKEFDEEKLKRAFKKFVKRVEKELFNNVKLGISYNVHIWSTKTLKPHPHIHCILPNVVEKEGQFYRFRPYFDVEKLRKIWKECLGIDCEPDLRVEYIKVEGNRGKIAHKVKYASRKAVIDIVSYFINNNREPEIDENWARKLIEYKNRRTTIGFLRKMSKLIGENKEKKHYCPICGGESEEVEALRFDEFEDMFRDGRLLIVFYDPKARWYKIAYNALNEDSCMSSLIHGRGDAV